MENLIVNKEKLFAFEKNLREKVTEDVSRIKLTEFMFQFLMFVNALIFWQLQCRQFLGWPIKYQPFKYDVNHNYGTASLRLASFANSF
jgi:hypothetical protein